MDRNAIEKSGAAFDPQRLVAAREKTMQAVREIAARMSVGMYEEDAYEIAKTTLASLGAEKSWHRSWIRFGANTLKSYGQLSEPRVRLGPDDIFFVDIGPVWDGYEGDGGDSFVTGTNPDMARCAAEARLLHQEVSRRWRSDSPTGEALYRFAEERARRLGWVLNIPGANGHRLSDFPHAVHFRGGLAEVDFTPSSCAWMLEIQIRHPDLPFGAFYEDLLLI